MAMTPHTVIEAPDPFAGVAARVTALTEYGSLELPQFVNGQLIEPKAETKQNVIQIAAKVLMMIGICVCRFLCKLK